jgi:alpha-maltose-1-phosphate synthase
MSKIMSKKVAININLSTSGSRLGGAAIASEYHSRYMAKHFPVELWRMWDQDEEIEIDSLKVRNFCSQTPFSVLERFLPRRIRSCFLDSDILSHLLSQNPAIVHLHNPIPSFAFENITRTASRSGIKVVASTHGFFEVMNPDYNLKSYETYLWKQVITNPVIRALGYIDALLTLYPDEKEMLQEKGVPEHRIHLISNGVNPFFLQSPQSSDCVTVFQKFNLNQDHPILLFIGNHTANKGLDTVLRVASQLSRPVTVVVGGRLLTPDEPQQWQTKLPPSSEARVVFTDFLSLTEQRALYSLATLLLFPSLSDTLPLTIIEAMACGLPVVAYDVGGIAYQLANDAGVVVPKGQFSAYISAIEMLLADRNRCTLIATNAKARQREIFSWESAAQKTINVYQSLLS